MQLIDRLPVPDATVMNPAAQPISGLNQRIYARLKTSLRLNLRRQIFLAVCDDLELRDRLVARLQAEFHPRFIGLNLNLSDPNPMAQVTQWLTQHPARAISRNARLPFGFQILGVENLTRQPAPVQKRFLTNLQAVDYYLPGMECTMLLWLPRPWLRMVQQAAPAFLDWHTALFEFEGDPTPVRPATSPSTSRVNIWLESAAAQKHQHAVQKQQHAKTSQQNGHHTKPAANPVNEQEPITPTDVDNVTVLHHAADRENLWDILTYDLAHLDEAAGGRALGAGQGQD
ncbi:MAG: hypothetical protein HC866_14460 [Leptolyngbyaceae cyanobacterium RU_5_1]|nr:hypothetical protein [Leptolyngbyaceae cyanobacterium RU_5_1]